jgi:hypothetical protein
MFCDMARTYWLGDHGFKLGDRYVFHRPCERCGAQMELQPLQVRRQFCDRRKKEKKAEARHATHEARRLRDAEEYKIGKLIDQKVGCWNGGDWSAETERRSKR